uniref:DUF6883 domain-containing protein n=1 Tax=uncultured Sphingomonas sp. TaxID=158754 RepID=UPI0035CC36CD
MTPTGDVHVIEIAKLTDYMLSAIHPTGKAKAKFFAAFGFDVREPATFADALEKHARTRPVASIVNDPFGTKREIRCNIAIPDGRDPCIVAIWLQPFGRNTLRFITAYPAPVR